MVPAPALDTWRSASGSGPGGLGGGDEAGDWFIRPDDVVICRDPRGNDWQLGSGAYGSVRRRPVTAAATHSTRPQEVSVIAVARRVRRRLAAWPRHILSWRALHASLLSPTQNLVGSQCEPLQASASRRGRHGQAAERGLTRRRPRRCTRACCRAARPWR